VPNQRDPNKVKMNFWLTEEEKKSVKKDMRKLGIKTYTDYILYKLGMEREEDDDK